MSVTTTRRYGGKSAEERASDRRRAFIDAGLDMIGTDGWTATSVRGVCARANLASRFFYQEFADLDALAVAVFDEIVADALTAVLEAAAEPTDLAGKARAAISTFIDKLAIDPRRARIVFTEAISCEPLSSRRSASLLLVAATAAKQARAWTDLSPATDAVLDPHMIFLAGGVDELIRAWLSGGIIMSQTELVDMCVRNLLSSPAR